MQDVCVTVMNAFMLVRRVRVCGGGTTWSSSREESMLYDMNARRHHDTRCGVVSCDVMMLSLFVVAAGASRLA